MTNATEGVNTVLRSLRFEPGDELLTNTHEYNACNNVLRMVAEKHGAKVVMADVPFPVRSAREVADAVLWCLDHPSTEVSLPASSGLLTTLGYLVPGLQRVLRPVLTRRGARNKAAYRAVLASRKG